MTHCPSYRQKRIRTTQPQIVEKNDVQIQRSIDDRSHYRKCMRQTVIDHPVSISLFYSLWFTKIVLVSYCPSASLFSVPSPSPQKNNPGGHVCGVPHRLCGGLMHWQLLSSQTCHGTTETTTFGSLIRSRREWSNYGFPSTFHGNIA